MLAQVRHQGRSRTLTKIGLAMYWLMLPLALAGLWVLRRWRAALAACAALAAGASALHTFTAITATGRSSSR